MGGIARRLFGSSVAQAWRAARARLSGASAGTAIPPLAPVEPAFLRSAEYRRLMAEHLPDPRGYDRHEAQNETPSFRFRHHEMRHRLGAFRWRGLQEHLDEVLALVEAPGATIADLGGAACPVHAGAVVVDRLPRDGWGRPVPYADLSRLPAPVDGVFTSHALEHFDDLDRALEAIERALRPGGRLIAHLPSYTCVRWRAGHHANEHYGDHRWTFGLSGDAKPEGLIGYRDVDTAIGERFAIEVAAYCGDDSIFVSAVRR
jgi:SAM-dependent methyltransferase